MGCQAAKLSKDSGQVVRSEVHESTAVRAIVPMKPRRSQGYDSPYRRTLEKLAKVRRQDEETDWRFRGVLQLLRGNGRRIVPNISVMRAQMLSREVAGAQEAELMETVIIRAHCATVDNGVTVVAEWLAHCNLIARLIWEISQISEKDWSDIRWILRGLGIRQVILQVCENVWHRNHEFVAIHSLVPPLIRKACPKADR